MTGLLLKDLLVLRKTARLYLVMLAFYLALTLAGFFDGAMVAGFTVLFTMMLPITSFSYDELARWEKYGACLPDGRRRLVGGKYLLALLLGGTAAALVAAAALVMTLLSGRDSAMELLQTGAALIVVGLLMNCILLPLLFRFGAEKGRLILLGIFAALFLGGISVSKALSGGWLSLPDSLPHPALLALAALAAVCLPVWLSFRISLRIMRKKSF